MAAALQLATPACCKAALERNGNGRLALEPPLACGGGRLWRWRPRQRQDSCVRGPLPLPVLCLASSASPARSASAGAASQARLVKDDLLAAIAGSERGVRTCTAQERGAVLRPVEALAALGAEAVTTGPGLSATWRLLWTTERETLFILRRAAGWFGTRAGDVLQVIDVEKARLNNVILFPPSGAFIVDSTLQVASHQRMNFRFTGAKLKTVGRTFGLPPFGQGWLDSVYMDDQLRVAKDSRGDVLIVERAPYAWTDEV
eukprot:SM000094S24714  [mRNA]  locus=s94:307657:309735:- [translate_table: standard]